MRLTQSLAQENKAVDLKFLVLNSIDQLLDDVYLNRMTRKELIMGLVSLKEDVLNKT